MPKRESSMHPGALHARGARLRQPSKRSGIGILLLLPLLLPAAVLAAYVVAFVARIVLKVAYEVSAGLLEGLGWAVWPIGILLVLRVWKRARPAPRAEEPVAPPPAAAPPERVSPPASPLATLAEQTHAWLGEQLSTLPVQLKERICSMQSQLSALVLQLQAGSPDALTAAELDKVLRDELPELIRAYHKVPRALQQRTLRGGMTPEQQLSAGLATLDAQLGALHERLAAPDLQALAVHQRYLDLKYNPSGS